MLSFRARQTGGLAFFCAMAAFAAPKAAAQVKSAPVTAPAAMPAVKGKLVPVPKEEYGEQNGEKVLPVNGRVPNTVMRARHEDTFLKLSNPRLSSDAKRTTLLVDYEVTSRGKLDGGYLVLRTDDGGKAEVELKSIVGRDTGTIELGGMKQFGNFKFGTNTKFPEDMELFVARGDDRYDPPSRYMVSNAIVMGKMKTSTKPRDWTPEEYAKYKGAPLAYKNPNGFPDVGVDVPPQKNGPSHSRFVDPDGRLLGLDYMVGKWEGQQTVWRLHPVYRADQPQTHNNRSVARKGYAVAGAEVNMGKSVVGIRLLFQNVKPDGTFDPKDAYVGDWIGTAPTGEPTKLVNDGRRVIGIHSFLAAVIQEFSLVVADEKK
jgi:hypothetical protein